jgi:hypothetical protein
MAFAKGTKDIGQGDNREDCAYHGQSDVRIFCHQEITSAGCVLPNGIGRSLFFSNNEELVAEEIPSDGEFEVGFDEERGCWFFAGHGVWEEAGVGLKDSETSVFKSFAEGAFGEG